MVDDGVGMVVTRSSFREESAAKVVNMALDMRTTGGRQGPRGGSDPAGRSVLVECPAVVACARFMVVTVKVSEGGFR